MVIKYNMCLKPITICCENNCKELGIRDYFVEIHLKTLHVINLIRSKINRLDEFSNFLAILQFFKNNTKP